MTNVNRYMGPEIVAACRKTGKAARLLRMR